MSREEHYRRRLIRRRSPSVTGSVPHDQNGKEQRTTAVVD